MINQQLIDFIKQEQAGGKNQKEITAALLDKGWKETDIAEGFATLNSKVTLAIPAGPLPSVTEILSEAWSLYNRHFWLLVGTGAVATFVWGAVALFVGGGVISASFLHPLTTGPMIILAIIILIVLVIAAIYIGLWGQIALIFAIKDSEENITIAEAFNKSRPYINSYFTVALCSGLVIFGGFILFIIPGVLALIWYGYAPYASITENLKTGAAMKYTKNLTSGRFGAIFWRMFFGILLAIIVSMLVNGALSLVGLGKYAQILASALSLIWTPLFTTYGFLVYRHMQASR